MKKLLLGAAFALTFAGLSSANVVILDQVAGPCLTTPACSSTSAGTGGFTGDTQYDYVTHLDGTQTFTSSFQDAYCISAINGLAASSATMVLPGSLPVGATGVSSLTGFNLYTGGSGGCATASSAGGINLNSGVPGQNTGAWIEVVYTGTATIASGTYLPTIQFDSLYTLSLADNMGYGGAAEATTGSNQNYNQGQLSGPNSPPSSTPEPATMTLFGSALLGLGFFARKRIKKG